MKIKPSFSEFKQLAQQGNLIPVYQEFLADTETPISAYLKQGDGSYSYLLESADGGKRWGRYSFISCKPYLSVVSRDRDVEIWREDAREILAEAVFTACRRMIIFDHFTHMVKVVAFAHLDKEKDLEQGYRRACREVTETIEQLHGPLPSALEDEPLLVSDLSSNFRREDFEKAVSKAKEHIVAGDVIQVVLSQKFSGAISGEDFSLTYNLVQMLEQMDQEVEVFRNDRIDIKDIETRNPSSLMISPGPGTPASQLRRFISSDQRFRFWVYVSGIRPLQRRMGQRSSGPIELCTARSP